MAQTPTPTPRHRLEAGLFNLLEGVVRGLPWDTVRILGSGLGQVFHLLDARHRKVVRDNIRSSNLGLTEAQVRSLSLDCFKHFGSLLLTGIHLLHMPVEELERRVTIQGLEHYDAAKAWGKGFLVITGHYGNWEAMALALSAKGRNISVIGRELDNPLLEPRLRALRGRFGNEVIPKAGAFKEAIKGLRKGKAVGFLLDQDALTSGVFVKFLGRWASTFPSAGLLAVKYGLPVVSVFSWPNPDGTITVRVDPPFKVPITGDMDKDVWVATQLMTARIEANIRRDPRWWFWMHRRFKTRPGEGSPLPAPLPPDEWVAPFVTNAIRG
jgi:KDO2-lipid IV(A) lauroyltransferase